MVTRGGREVNRYVGMLDRGYKPHYIGLNSVQLNSKVTAVNSVYFKIAKRGFYIELLQRNDNCFK